MEGVVRLRFLGTVEVERDGEPERGFRSRKALALLGYLATQRQPVPRDRLAELFWENKPEDRGRANLSWVLRRISILLPGCLQVDLHTVQFQRAAPYWSDVDAFEELEARGDAASLADAVALYRGEFLEGVRLEGCAEFELWLVVERERWRERVVCALGELVGHHSQRGEHVEGLHFARRLLALEPWREKTHQQVMRLLALNGQRGAALAQYETCRRVLEEELGVEPGPETVQLYRQIRDEASRATAPSVPAHSLKQPFQPPDFLDEKAAQPKVAMPVFVARKRELARLDGFLGLALAGQGRVAFVAGEAGSGKTALLHEFARRAQGAHPDLLVAGGNGVAYTGLGDPYHLFREVLSLLTGEVEPRWRAGAITTEQARRLWNALPLTAQALVREGPELIGAFVAGEALVGRARACVPSGAEWLAELEELVGRKAGTPPGTGPQQSAFFARYTRVLQSLARQVPLLLILDDLQWADAGSISLLFHLGRQLAGSRILVVGAYRPEEVALERNGKRHPLEAVVNELRRDLGELTVDLEQAPGREFVEALLDSEPNRLGAEFRETLYRQTRAHPLFTVELLRGMEERGDLVKDSEGRWVEGPALDWKRLPARVEAVIGERIGRLPEGLRGILRAASVEGETFTAEVAAWARGLDGREVEQWWGDALERRHHLVTGQGVRWVRGQRLSRYRFRHILFQKYLYDSLGAVERAHLHGAVGTALERLYGGQTDEIAVELAYHFQQAGRIEKPIDYLRQAGEQAVRMSANEEAIVHFRRGLTLLEVLPDTSERARQELALQVGLIVALQAVEGYGASEAGRACARARELCGQVGETSQIYPVLWLLAGFSVTRGDLHTGHDLAKQFLDLVESAEGPAPIAAVAHLAQGRVCLFLGELLEARAHLERSVALHDPRQRRSLAFVYGTDPGVGAPMFLSWVLWLLGYPEQALKRSEEALALAYELAHPFNLASMQGMVGVLHTLRRDVRRVQELGEACIRLSTEHGFSYWLATGLYCRGWTLVEQGKVREGMTLLRQSIVGNQATEAEVGHPQRLVELARAYGRIGQAEEGLALLDEALATAHRNAEVHSEAEIHRLRGKLLLSQGDEAEAEACFQRAIAVARRQSAKMWELRAAVSLSRLWQRQGKRKRARKRLAEIYGWFTEGFDTPDLREARALLDELS